MNILAIHFNKLTDTKSLQKYNFSLKCQVLFMGNMFLYSSFRYIAPMCSVGDSNGCDWWVLVWRPNIKHKSAKYRLVNGLFDTSIHNTLSCGSIQNQSWHLLTTHWESGQFLGLFKSIFTGWKTQTLSDNKTYLFLQIHYNKETENSLCLSSLRYTLLHDRCSLFFTVSFW